MPWKEASPMAQRTQFIAGPRSQPLGLAARGLLLHLDAGPFFDGEDDVGTSLPESLDVEMLDEQRQRQFPGLLVMVVELAHFLRIQPELARHLDLRVGQAKPLPGVDPHLKMVRDALVRHGLFYLARPQRR